MPDCCITNQFFNSQAHEQAAFNEINDLPSGGGCCWGATDYLEVIWMLCDAQHGSVRLKTLAEMSLALPFKTDLNLFFGKNCEEGGGAETAVSA